MSHFILSGTIEEINEPGHWVSWINIFEGKIYPD